MAGGDDHAGGTAQLQNGIGELRHAVQRGIEAAFDAESGQQQGGILGKDVALQAGIVGNGHGAARLALLLQIGSQPCGGAAHGIEVHAVGAQAEHTAHPGSAKFQKAVEAVAESRFLLCQSLQFFRKLRQSLLPLGIVLEYGRIDRHNSKNPF